MVKSKIVYLDYAAATPMHSDVIKAAQPYLSDQFANPSALYSQAVKVKQDLEAARSEVAVITGVKSSQVIFCAGATEANNLAVQGIMSQYHNGNIIVSAIEHESVLEPAKKFNYKIAKVNQEGQLDLDDLKRKIDDKTVLISIIYANNEIGTIQQLRKISQVIQDILSNRKNAYPLILHSDAAQAGNYLDLHKSRLGVDMLSINGSKIYGPKQTGVLITGMNIKLNTLIMGGGQENNLRSGTPNVSNFIGFAKALELAQKNKLENYKKIIILRKYFETEIKKIYPRSTINGSKKRLENIISLTLPGFNSERLIYQLDNYGIMVAAGSACSASDDASSHVLKAIGISNELSKSTLRVSLGNPTSENDIKYLLNCLNQIIAKIT